ncbi:MAG: hypothetical protein CL627_14545 [Aurantimonas sp.]|nr:hypothetical protein [Aurantimonas sp.]
MITSIKKNRFYDDACVLDVGDHEFITHPSYLLYRLAETDLAIHLSNMVQKRFYLQKQDFRPEVYDRIVDGLRISDELPSRVIAYAESRMII